MLAIFLSPHDHDEVQDFERPGPLKEDLVAKIQNPRRIRGKERILGQKTDKHDLLSFGLWAQSKARVTAGFNAGVAQSAEQGPCKSQVAGSSPVASSNKQTKERRMKKILVVIDAQNDFIDGALGSEGARSVVDNIVKKIREQHREYPEQPVLCTLDSHQKYYLNTCEGRNLPVPHCIIETSGWEYNKQIKRELDRGTAYYFYKEQFGSPELAGYIKQSCELEATDIIEIVGYCTDICVLANAILIKSFCPEIAVVVDTSCCAASDTNAELAAKIAMESCGVFVK